jgi:hypothetical protein
MLPLRFVETTMLKVTRTLIAAALGLAIASSCASGDPERERVEATEQAQRNPCALAKDGTVCTTLGGESGACLDGVCCVCVNPLLKTCITTCDDRNPCTADSCGTKGCLHEVVRNGTACGGGRCVDGRCCTGCIDSTGTCRGNGEGDPEFCGLGGVTCAVCKDDDNVCSDDICNNLGKCEYPPKENGVQCESDGDICNGTSRCEQGQCKDGAPLNCNNNNPCVTTSCDPAKGCIVENNTASCEDGDPCTVNDRCSGGSCQAGTGVKCEDNNPCTENERCDSKVGGCVHDDVAPNTGCDDRNGCSTNDRCDGDGRCVGTGGPQCKDGNPCTIDGCNAGTQVCDFTGLEDAGTPCVPSDDKCILNASCNAQGVCTGGVAKDCNDSNPCTEDSCDPTTGECVTTDLEGDECSDDSACTTNDHCDRGACVGEPIDCTASDDCHEPGSCDEATGRCSDLRKENGADCGSGTGTCNNNGVCIPNPVTGAGGAGGESGEPTAGAPPADGGTSSAEGGAAGQTSSGGRAGSSTGGTSSTAGSGNAPNAGDEGDDDEVRGAPFKRKPGGCSLGAPGGSYAAGLPFALVAGLMMLARRRRSRTDRRTRAAGGTR